MNAGFMTEDVFTNQAFSTADGIARGTGNLLGQLGEMLEVDARFKAIQLL